MASQQDYVTLHEAAIQRVARAQYLIRSAISRCQQIDTDETNDLLLGLSMAEGELDALNSTADACEGEA